MINDEEVATEWASKFWAPKICFICFQLFRVRTRNPKLNAKDIFQWNHFKAENFLILQKFWHVSVCFCVRENERERDWSRERERERERKKENSLCEWKIAKKMTRKHQQMRRRACCFVFVEGRTDGGWLPSLLADRALLFQAKMPNYFSRGRFRIECLFFERRVVVVLLRICPIVTPLHGQTLFTPSQPQSDCVQYLTQRGPVWPDWAMISQFGNILSVRWNF